MIQIFNHTIDTSTRGGFEKAVKFQSNFPEWNLITKSFCDFDWLFEMRFEVIDGKVYSHEVGKWVDLEEFNNYIENRYGLNFG